LFLLLNFLSVMKFWNNGTGGAYLMMSPSEHFPRCSCFHPNLKAALWG